ncbi:hypothetical protein GA0115246_102598 [Streptomyces sp. SolWspMP-sol7th]|nr:hypothetical protein GA0115246_102598 [Streptomyces sp. SolWspMP-sol7th]
MPWRGRPRSRTGWAGPPRNRAGRPRPGTGLSRRREAGLPLNPTRAPRGRGPNRAPRGRGPNRGSEPVRSLPPSRSRGRTWAPPSATRRRFAWRAGALTDRTGTRRGPAWRGPSWHGEELTPSLAGQRPSPARPACRNPATHEVGPAREIRFRQVQDGAVAIRTLPLMRAEHKPALAAFHGSHHRAYRGRKRTDDRLRHAPASRQRAADNRPAPAAPVRLPADGRVLSRARAPIGARAVRRAVAPAPSRGVPAGVPVVVTGPAVTCASVTGQWSVTGEFISVHALVQQADRCGVRSVKVTDLPGGY